MCFCKVVCGQLELGQLDRYMLLFSLGRSYGHLYVIALNIM